MRRIPNIFHRSQHSSAKQEHVEQATDRTRDVVSVVGDNPITLPEDDTLGRASVARSFAHQVLELDSRQGVVVGVLGAWGTGKTSFINLAHAEFDRAHVPVLDFNPWMFSGAEQLVERFFTELAAQLKVRPAFADIAQDIARYGEALTGLAGIVGLGVFIPIAGVASEALNKALERRRREGIGGRRAKLVKALSNKSQPMVVVLDDIDRLSSAEIREVFKLVRLTASFPNIIYIVAFDRSRVEQALSEEGIPGRDYLEKILQVAVDLPAAPSHFLQNQILKAIEDALSGITNPGPFDNEIWPDLFMEIVRPPIRNMRDVRRYAAALHGTVNALKGEIALADVLALEAVRTFLPDVYAQLHCAFEALTKTASFTSLSYGSSSEETLLKASIDSLIAAGHEYEGVVRSMVRRLFPAAERHMGGSHYGDDWKGTWLRERRVAHEDILSLYLERVAGEGLLAFTDAERAFALLADRAAFDTYLRSLDAEHLEHVIASLQLWEKDFAPEHVVSGTIVLMNLLSDLPERPRGMFEVGARHIVYWVTTRLLQSLTDPGSVEAAVREILPELTSLGAKLELIEDVGYRKGMGHKLVSEAAAVEFERNWREAVRSASKSELEDERQLFSILLVVKQQTEIDEPQLSIPQDSNLTLAILRSARSDVRSQSAGSIAMRRSPQLAWDALTELFGSLDELTVRIDQLRQSKPEGETELFSLVDKYLGGWRPSEFGGD
jgi:predicted KAP-like P-loop ATPase